jgi:hypothetical protein
MNATEIPTPHTDAAMMTFGGRSSDAPLEKVYADCLEWARKLEREIIRLQKLIGVDELDEIKSLLPDESPCKHEQTGCSLYDDIRELVLRSEGNTKTFSEIAGALFSIPYSGTIVDGVKAVIAIAQTHTEMRKVLEANGFNSFTEAIAEAKKYRAMTADWPHNDPTVESDC